MIMEIGQGGINLIKQFEGCKLSAYKDSAGIWTIGYGHTGDVTSGQQITEKKAEELLVKDLASFVKQVNSGMKSHNITLNQNQFDALVSYTYNRGVKGLKELLDNSKTVKDISPNIEKYWGSNQKAVVGLKRRRKAERLLFDTAVVKEENPYSVPTKILKYSLDIDDEVKWVQWQLDNVFGYDLKIDGQYGNKTQSAVSVFQSKAGLDVDGKVGDKTLKALKG